MHTALLIGQIIIAVILSLTILLQSKGTGLGSAWGGGGEFYRTKRGAEKAIFTSTIFLAVAFVLTSIALMLI